MILNIVILSSLFMQAQDFDRQASNINKDFIKNYSSDIPTPKLNTDKSAQKELTIMIFMNGKNNLADYVLKDINEMEVYGPRIDMNIVVQAGRINYTPPSYDPYDPYDPYPWGGPGIHPHWPPMPPYMNKNSTAAAAGISSFTGVKRFLIQKDADTNSIGSKEIETLSKSDMGDPQELVNFALWAKKNFPAKKYMLMVWNHGDGWKRKNIMPDLIKGISSDDETGNDISTPELGQALSKIGKLDIYASDACLMQMMEVVYELKDSVPIIVGSEETEPGDGWAYDYFLKKIHSLSSLSTQEVAKAAVEAYGEYYTEKGKGVTQSALKTAKIDELRYKLDLWADAAMKNISKEKLKESLKKSLGFEASGSRDLIDFIKIASQDSQNQSLISQAKDIEYFINNSILIKNTYAGDSYKRAGGLAVYLPEYSYDNKYDGLKFSQIGIWDDFLKWLYQ
ncbi:MAG: clostripain-related cysteine peptidase [Elusimicrobiota bacterium]